MNKTFIQKIKDFWNDHKTVIKVGATFGALGFIYGAYEGCTTTSKIWLDSLNKAMDEAKAPCDELGSADDILDDPE